MKIDKSLMSGSTTLLILSLLAREEMYGYQMIVELARRSNRTFELKEGTLYPILYRMEDDGLVTSKWSEPRGKEVSKKYYRITGQGKETLLRLKLLWRAFSESVDEIIED